MNTIFEKIKNIFWENKMISSKEKEKLFYEIKGIVRGKGNRSNFNNDLLLKYINDILNIQNYNDDKKYVAITSDYYIRKKDDSKLIAYYLPQYYPTEYNDKWWGKGSTEWTNVTKAMPQYIGHYQPRLAGELGYYDLRIDENIERQVELAKMYGIYGFCYYYYWFNGKRLLDVPFNKFLSNKNIKFPYCICWVNESWSKQWFGSSEEILMKQDESEESYKNFIIDAAKYLLNDNYINIKGKKLLVIYRPYYIPNIKKVLDFWRKYVYKEYGIELYILGAMNNKYSNYRKWDFVNKGFDAIGEFALGSQKEFLKEIKSEKIFVCKEYLGDIYSYSDFINNRAYFKERLDKLYRAVCPMWDNSSRKINKGIIFDGSTPDLYKKWLIDIIKENKIRNDLDDDIIFINAWNEWAEGAYLEPDRYWGYAYLQATKDAIEESRQL